MKHEESFFLLRAKVIFSEVNLIVGNHDFLFQCQKSDGPGIVLILFLRFQ